MRYCVKGVVASGGGTASVDPIFNIAGTTRIGSATPNWRVIMGVAIAIALPGPPPTYSYHPVTYLVMAVDAATAVATATALAVVDFPTAAPVAGAAYAYNSIAGSGTGATFEPLDIVVEADTSVAALAAAALRVGSLAPGAAYTPLTALEGN